MAYVGFKRGLQASLDQMITNIASADVQNRLIDGYFYLTSDTDRLYVCRTVSGSNTTKTLVELNKSITIVSSMADLTSVPASEGQFYYVSDDNILCIYKNNAWHQINPDHRLASSINNTEVSAISGNTNGARVTIEVADDDPNTPHTSTGSFDIVGTGAIEITRNNNVISINTAPGVDTQYDLTAAQEANNGGASITLADRNTGASHEEDKITFVGTDQIGVSATGNTITIQGPPRITATDAAFNANGVLTIETSVDSQGTIRTGSVTPIVRVGDDGNGTSTQNDIKFNNGTAVLPVYTAREVDAKINNAIAAADAMTYRGTVASANDLQSKYPNGAGTQRGDTYKASDSFTFNTKHVNLGDLLVFNAADGADPTDEANWDIVPSGDDQMISVVATANSNKLAIEDNSIELGSLSLVAGDKIAITSTASNGGLVTTIGQASDYTAQTVAGYTTAVTQTDHESVTFDVLTGITTDVYGNVVNGSVKSASITIKDTHANIEEVNINASDVSGETNTVQISTEVVDSDNVGKQHSFKLASQNLTVSSQQGSSTNPDTVSINLEWGSF